MGDTNAGDTMNRIEEALREVEANLLQWRRAKNTLKLSDDSQTSIRISYAGNDFVITNQKVDKLETIITEELNTKRRLEAEKLIETATKIIKPTKLAEFRLKAASYLVDFDKDLFLEFVETNKVIDAADDSNHVLESLRTARNKIDKIGPADPVYLQQRQKRLRLDAIINRPTISKNMRVVSPSTLSSAPQHKRIHAATLRSLAQDPFFLTAVREMYDCVSDSTPKYVIPDLNDSLGVSLVSIPGFQRFLGRTTGGVIKGSIGVIGLGSPSCFNVQLEDFHNSILSSYICHANDVTSEFRPVHQQRMLQVLTIGSEKQWENLNIIQEEASRTISAGKRTEGGGKGEMMRRMKTKIPTTTPSKEKPPAHPDFVVSTVEEEEDKAYLEIRILIAPQMPTFHGNPADFVCTLDFDGAIIPLSIFEPGASDKQYQMFGDMENVSQSLYGLPADICFIGLCGKFVGGGVQWPFTSVLYGGYFSPDGNDLQMVTLLEIEISNPFEYVTMIEKYTRLMHIHAYTMASRLATAGIVRLRNTRIARDCDIRRGKDSSVPDRVFKFHPKPSSFRDQCWEKFSPNVLEHIIQGLTDNEGVIYVLCYVFDVEKDAGNTTNPNAFVTGKHLVTLLHKVFALVDKVVHGDIRRSNVQFTTDDNVVLIDWELAALPQEKYPQNYNNRVPERHNGAQPGANMLHMHDQYSALQILSQYRPLEEGKSSEWTTAVDAMISLITRDSESVEIGDLLEEGANAALRLRGGHTARVLSQLSKGPTYWEEVKAWKFLHNPPE